MFYSLGSLCVPRGEKLQENGVVSEDWTRFSILVSSPNSSIRSTLSDKSCSNHWFWTQTDMAHLLSQQVEKLYVGCYLPALPGHTQTSLPRGSVMTKPSPISLISTLALTSTIRCRSLPYSGTPQVQSIPNLRDIAACSVQFTTPHSCSHAPQ